MKRINETSKTDWVDLLLKISLMTDLGLLLPRPGAFTFYSSVASRKNQGSDTNLIKNDRAAQEGNIFGKEQNHKKKEKEKAKKNVIKDV